MLGIAPHSNSPPQAGERVIDRLVVLLLVLFLASCLERRAPPAPVVVGPGGARPGASAAATTARPDIVTVQPGDTLYAVSRRYDVPIRSIIEANNLTPPYDLSVGKRLVLPQVRQHIVQPGDTVYSVSRRYGVDTSTLTRANNLQPPFVIKLGQSLVLPAAVQGAAQVVSVPAAAPPPAAPNAASAPPPPVWATNSAANASAPNAPPPSTASPPAPPPPVQQAAAPEPAPLLPEAAPPAPAGKGFLWPVRGRLLGGFGPAANGTHNDGINIAAPLGTPVLAAEDGVVAYAGNELRGFGNLVLVKHAGGWMTAYAHCESIAVKRGDKVRRGQAIARVGETGAVGEPQLHFEMRRGTRALDPNGYLAPLPSA
jgi:murein DD-endopeptidase MepM/ murein hydrolase activator NlpD